MARRIVAALVRALSEQDAAPQVHFHQGTSTGQPVVCHDEKCTSPQLEVA